MWDIVYRFAGQLVIYRAFTEREMKSFLDALKSLDRKPEAIQLVLC